MLLGVTQEQHPDRCRLFAQWKGFDWPILHDPINLLEAAAVPIVVAIDEQGVVRSVRPKPETLEQDFLDREFHTGGAAPVPMRPPTPDPEQVARQAGAENTAPAWRRLGDALVLWGGANRVNEAIAAYEETLRRAPGDAIARFRLGVCYRLRSEGPKRHPGDFQAAVRAWDRAFAAHPNQYIWRRRIQQYGPRLEKPYPFYDWVDQATAEVRARGEKPIPLPVPPSGAEIAGPVREFGPEASPPRAPDPEGRILRDGDGLIRTEVVVVPSRIPAGQSARIHVSFHPNSRRMAHWNNEAEPLRLWIDPPPGWEISRRLLVAPQGDRPETNEVRRLEFEVRAPATGAGTVQFSAYALYYACENIGGTCRFLRQDIPITVEVRR